MATKDEVERQLGVLLARLDGNEARVRSAIPTRKVLRCLIPDLGAAWYSVVEHGHVGTQRRDPPGCLLGETRLADDLDVTLTFEQLLEPTSDDLVVVEEEHPDLVGRLLSHGSNGSRGSRGFR